MYKFYIIFSLVAAFAQADDEPFSIGLGVLSPSYSQTVGKENVKVNFEQKDNGFSYSVGDPSSGTNTYLNFGAAAAGPSVNPAGYADANPSGYADVSPAAGYTGPNPSAGYTGPNPSAGYAGPNPSAYTGPSPSAYTGPSSSGYVAPQANPSFSGFAGYQAPSYGASSGLGASGFGSSGLGASGFGSSGLGASGFGSSSGLGVSGFGSSSGLGASGFGSSSGLGGSTGFFNMPSASPGSSSAYLSESARKPEENPAQILPAGFSYHGTEGQAFLRQGEDPNFVISDEKKEAARGIAEQSFSQSSGKVLKNGLVGYGPGGARGGSLPVGGYAGPQFAGLVKEHGGHTSQDA